MKAILFDASLCNGCYGCQMACKDEHCGNSWLPIAAEQPMTGEYWCRVDQRTRGKVPEVKVEYVPRWCDSDEELLRTAPECVYKREDGIVIIDPEKAKGRKDLADKFDGVYWNEELELPQKCTMCAHLLDDGWTVPRCVDACAHDVLRFGDEEEFAEELKDAEILRPDLNTQPSVVYLNLPKRFIGGEIADLEADEVIIGAKVVLTNKETGETRETTSDWFGDFWFKQIEAAEYTISVEAKGYLPRTVKDFISTVDKDLNVGTIAMYKA